MTERKIALSIEEAADYTGIGRNTLRKLVETNGKFFSKAMQKESLILVPVLYNFISDEYHSGSHLPIFVVLRIFLRRA